MDRIDLLRIFLRVAEAGSFSAAAEQLALPRATVSWAVQRLESLLKARLLHRTTRRVTLSQEGEALLDQARTLVADMEDLESRFQPADEVIAGRLRVDLPSRIARRLVAPALPEFLQRFPRTHRIRPTRLSRSSESQTDWSGQLFRRIGTILTPLH